MKKWQRRTVHAVAKRMKDKVEKNGTEQFINLFNSGIVLDLKKLKIKALETLMKALEK